MKYYIETHTEIILEIIQDPTSTEIDRSYPKFVDYLNLNNAYVNALIQLFIWMQMYWRCYILDQ